MSGRLEVQFVSVNHNKYVPYPQSEDKPPRRMSLGPTASDPRSAKSLHPFDLLSISDQLPPNTGPAGTVPVNGSSSSSTSNKNLSHVPCKFYRQGICQAGNSCPFSHNLDGTLAADKLPCKYFQKGNCKFGLKCALAHFLPDGTRVNSKGLLSYRRGNDRGERGDRGDRNDRHDRNDRNERGDRSGYYGGYSSSNTVSASSNNASSAASAVSGSSQQFNNRQTSAPNSKVVTPVSEPIDISANPILRSRHSSTGSSGAPGAIGSSTHSASTSAQSKYQRSGPSSFHHSNNNYIALGANASFSNYTGNDLLFGNSPFNATSNPFSTTGPKLTGSSMFRSLSSNSPPNFLMNSPISGEFNRQSSDEYSDVHSAFHSPQTQFSTPYSKFSRYLAGVSSSPQHNFHKAANESAVIDDDSEENFDDDDNAFFEDFVPASLGNLILTPQERQRRDLRSQSGTLLVRPTIGSNVSFDKRSDRKATSDDVFLMD